MKRQPLQRELSPQRTFFELMRRVEAWQWRQPTAGAPFRLRRRPDWLSLEQAADMRFASAEISAVQLDAAAEEGGTPRVNVTCRHFGLFAPYGPLPLHVTEHALHERRLERNAAFERFVNLACGDLAWLHYAARAAMHPVLGYERGRHPFAERVAALAGMPPSGAEERNHDAASCRFGTPGAYHAPSRSLTDLRKILAGYFGVPVRLMPRRGRWVPLRGAGGPRRLGRWRVGGRIWDAQQALEIRVGPIDAAEFCRWQRGAAAMLAMRAIAADFAAGQAAPVIQIQVRTRPELAGKVGRMRLGVDAWSRPGNALRTLTVYDSFQDPRL